MAETGLVLKDTLIAQPTTGIAFEVKQGQVLRVVLVEGPQVVDFDVFNSDNLAGVVTEWWIHNASSYWFLAERHTVSDEIIRTFDPQELFKQRVDFAVPAKVEEATV